MVMNPTPKMHTRQGSLGAKLHTHATARKNLYLDDHRSRISGTDRGLASWPFK